MTSDHSIYEYFLRGEYSLGAAQFEQQADPKDADQLWYGYCLLNLGREFEAKQSFGKAMALGNQGGRIGLSRIYSLMGQLELSERTLAQVEPSTLEPVQQIFWLRERAKHLQLHGELNKASQLLEEAWIIGQALPSSTKVLLTSIAQQLGGLYARQGKAKQAIPFYEYAMKHEIHAKRPYLQGSLALNLCYQGKIQAALEMIENAISTNSSFLAAAAVLQYELGVISRAAGKIEQAANAFQQSVKFSQLSGEEETECYAHLGQAMIWLDQNQLLQAELSLIKAEPLVHAEVGRLHLELRQERLRLAQKRPDIPSLKQLALAFKSRQLHRESAISQLFLAESHVHADQPEQAVSALQCAGQFALAYDGSAVLIPELKTLTGCRILLGKIPTNQPLYILKSKLIQNESEALTNTIKLRSLGNPKLEFNTQPVTPKLRRTIEVFSYLLLHPQVTLNGVQNELFPDELPKRSKSYFHQVRDEIAALCPGVEVRYDASSKTYITHLTNVKLDWDFLALKQCLMDVEAGKIDRIIEALVLYCGPFLPHTSSNWAETERLTLQNWLLQLGLRTMMDWYSSGDYQKCVSLAERLVQLDPFDDAMNEFLVKALREVQGEQAARTKLRRITRQYEDELNLVPSNLTSLGHELHLMN